MKRSIDSPTNGARTEVGEHPVARLVPLTVPQLDTYRAAVDDLHAELVRVDGALLDLPRLQATLRDRFDRPELNTVLERLPGGSDATANALGTEVRRYRPGSPSSARNAAALVRIYLLSQIDSVWWGTADPFRDARDITRSVDLVDLPELRRRQQLRFRFKLQPKGLPGRSRDWAVHRYLGRYEPHTAGLSLAKARPELVALLDLLALSFAAAAPSRTPPLWVTSALRTVEQQHRLRDLGYSALLPSAHCTGFAADVEMRWFARFDADRALASILLDHQGQGLVNLVDEGQAWHVCLSPEGREILRPRQSGRPTQG